MVRSTHCPPPSSSSAPTRGSAHGLSCKNPWIAATNLPGSIVGIYQLVTMLPLMKGHPKLGQVQAVILGGGTLTMGLWAKLIFGGATAAARSYALGLYDGDLHHPLRVALVDDRGRHQDARRVVHPRALDRVALRQLPAVDRLRHLLGQGHLCVGAEWDGPDFGIGAVGVEGGLRRRMRGVSGPRARRRLSLCFG